MPTPSQIKTAGAAVLQAQPLLAETRRAIANAELLAEELAARNHRLTVLPEEEMPAALAANASLLAILYDTGTRALPELIARLRGAADSIEQLGAAVAPLIEGYEPTTREPRQ